MTLYCSVNYNNDVLLHGALHNYKIIAYIACMYMYIVFCQHTGVAVSVIEGATVLVVNESVGGVVELGKLPNTLVLVMAVLTMVVLVSDKASDSVDIILLLILLSDELGREKTIELMLPLKDITPEDMATKEGDGNTINEDIADDTASSPLPEPLPTLWASLIPAKQKKINTAHKEWYSILSESGECYKKNCKDN